MQQSLRFLAGLVNSDDFGQQLLVHLYAISGSGHEKEAKLIDCNCSDYFNIRGDHSEDKSRAKMILDYGILYWQTKDSSNNHVDVSSLTSETSRLALSDTPSSYYDNIVVQPYYQTAYPSPPMQYETPSSPQYDNGHYHTNGDGTPINNSHGLVQTTKRSVHVANMSKRTKKKEMISLLQKYGVANYSDLDFHTDPTGRVTKGTAIIHYRHVSDAYKAEKELHGRSLNGRAIRAKRAKETVMVDSLEPSRPPVVNGSYGY